MNTEKLNKKKSKFTIFSFMHRYFFVSWHKHWKGIYLHLPKATHRIYFNSDWRLCHDKYSNIGARISQKLGVQWCITPK